MSLPVNKIEFWKDRIAFANKNGQYHFSVYIARSSLWKDIENAHKAILAKEIKDKDKVLDAGCGYGRSSEWINNYTGVDFSPDFIEEAKRRYPNKKFIQADLKKLPFKDNQFDVAFCISIKQMIIGNLGNEEWKLMEDEIKRVSKKFLILEYEEPSNYQIIWNK